MKKATLVFGMLLLGMFYYHNISLAQSELLGNPGTQFSLPNTVTGQTVSLSDYDSEKGVILVFTCNHCPYAKFYESRIIDLHNKFAPMGYPVVAISSNDPAVEPTDAPAEMKKLAKKHDYPFPYLYDESQAIAKAYNAKVTPHVYVLENSSEGPIVRYVGAIDDNAKDATAVTQRYVEAAVNALLNGQAVEANYTKAVGCGIKWKAN